MIEATPSSAPATPRPLTEAETRSVHILIDRTARWHATPIDEETFEALIAKYPYMPLRYAWVHLPGRLLGSEHSKRIAKEYPGWVTEDVPTLVAEIVDREVRHARYFLRLGTTDVMGFERTEDFRVSEWGEKPPELWATREAKRQLMEEAYSERAPKPTS